MLEVEVYPRVWHEQDTQFVGPTGTTAAQSEVHVVPLDSAPSFSTADIAPSGLGHGDEAETGIPDSDVAEATAAFEATDYETLPGASMIADDQVDVHDLVYRFLNLPFSLRVAIAGELDLLDPQEIGGQSEHAVFEQVFLRAREKGVLAEMQDKVRERGDDE